MAESELSRRRFHQLAAAALGGIVTGVTVGCNKKSPEKTGGKTTAGAGDGDSFLTQEPHVCRGLNTCKGKGKGGDNECAGQGTCATAEKHACDGMNECKGQGGCGQTAGRNSCEGKGECAVPLKPDAWKNARAAFEKAMKAKGKKVGETPSG